MATKKEFKKLLFTEVKKNINNNYEDNWDYELFGPEPRKQPLEKRINNFLSKIIPAGVFIPFLLKLRFNKHIDGFVNLYNSLDNSESKLLFLQVLTYRQIGHKKYKLPLSNKTYWENLQLAERLIVNKNENINPKFLGFILYKHNLKEIGYPILLYFTPLGILIDFIIKQYEYNVENKLIKAEKDDVVLDCGGCWGDTALFFSNEIGDNGRVYSFEFIPSNIDIFNKNLALNPYLAKVVTIIPNPVWNTSNQKLFYIDNGPASMVSNDELKNYSGFTNTISIDDFIKKENLLKVDLIKMDIEGAELNAIQGAKETLIKYRPKLAIALYHNLSDFYTILQFLQSLNLGYSFYFQHTTIHSGESVLFAQVN